MLTFVFSSFTDLQGKLLFLFLKENKNASLFMQSPSNNFANTTTLLKYLLLPFSFFSFLAVWQTTVIELAMLV